MVGKTQGVIYSLVSRGKETVLSSYSAYAGNFPNAALEVLKNGSLSKKYGKYLTGNFAFFVYVKQPYIFMAMVDPTYQTRIAIKYLKTIAEKFDSVYSEEERSNARAHQLKEFDQVLKDTMLIYADKAKVDKLCELKKEVNELEEISLKNLDVVIERGQKMELLVEKTETMSSQAFELNNLSRQVKNRMWWKNMRLKIAAAVGVLVLITVIVLIVV